MPSFGKAVTVAALGAALVGCAPKEPLEPSKSGAYSKAGEYTYRIDGASHFDRFPAGLKKFREEVQGDFILLPVTQGGYSYGAYAVSIEARTKGGGTNTVYTLNAAPHPGNRNLE